MGAAPWRLPPSCRDSFFRSPVWSAIILNVLQRTKFLWLGWRRTQTQHTVVRGGGAVRQSISHSRNEVGWYAVEIVGDLSVTDPDRSRARTKASNEHVGLVIHVARFSHISFYRPDHYLGLSMMFLTFPRNYYGRRQNQNGDAIYR
jgi:hypothetical protein